MDGTNKRLTRRLLGKSPETSMGISTVKHIQWQGDLYACAAFPSIVRTGA